MMKVLIGYDGSPSADATFEELKRAGLPGETKILVATVASIWMPTTDIGSLPGGRRWLRAAWRRRWRNCKIKTSER